MRTTGYAYLPPLSVGTYRVPIPLINFSTKLSIFFLFLYLSCLRFTDEFIHELLFSALFEFLKLGLGVLTTV